MFNFNEEKKSFQRKYDEDMGVETISDFFRIHAHL